MCTMQEQKDGLLPGSGGPSREYDLSIAPFRFATDTLMESGDSGGGGELLQPT